ncbi:MAG: 4-(cytidine 5'-diphospho)-2-C-methyl-D-erythritol kinase [Clostridiales bacterium]|nr:4-(cytidine 5'-diphospho)-2-C-methyl-D-erythritol kinase [Clostridiales bacterium]
MSNTIRLRAFAKVNLSLNITGRDGVRGMHMLDSVMMSVDMFDTVTVSPRTDSDIRVKFIGADFVPTENNTAYKAAKAVQDMIGCSGFDITVEKGIPVGAGLGGSSADGAAVLRALDVLYKLGGCGVDMRSVALSVGSDVPFMLTGGLARVSGFGEQLFFIENKLKLFMVGLMGSSVSTAAAYAKFDELYKSCKYCPTDNEKLCNLLLDGDNKAIEHLGNALYEPAVCLSPDIEKNAELLASYGGAVCLTGSGGMTLGYFTDIQRFYECYSALKSRGCRVFAPTKTGVLHERV